VIRLATVTVRRPEENAFSTPHDGRADSAGACFETGSFGADSSRSGAIVQFLLRSWLFSPNAGECSASRRRVASGRELNGCFPEPDTEELTHIASSTDGLGAGIDGDQVATLHHRLA
jgi:hypothetical protein